jgi:hypothetical protein
MNQKKAKVLRKIANEMVTSADVPVTRFYVEKQADGSVKDSVIPMPITWSEGTARRIYQDLK